MPQKWTVISFLVVLANIIVIGYLKGVIAVLIVKLTLKIMAHFNFINIGLLVTTVHAFLVKLGIPDAYLGAFDLVCPS